MKDKVFDLIEQEESRQRDGLELIPSENYVSKAVLRAMGSVLTNKYSEGYPNFRGLTSWDDAKIATEILPNYRYYGGQANIDRIERLAIHRACQLFNADHANVQSHSGANANEAVYFAWCKPGDKILAMDLASGGHLTHGSPVTRSAKVYDFLSYGVTTTGDLNYIDIEQKSQDHDLSMIIVGYSAFMKIPDFSRITKIRDQAAAKWGHEILLMADMSHVAGLIAGGVHPNPLDYGFNVMTTTTHKTLRGPRGGLILTHGKVTSPLKVPPHDLTHLPALIDRAVFPGTQGGPLEHIIAAKAIAFGEALQPAFKQYAKNVIKNAQILATSLQKHGFILQGNGTDNHLILIDIKSSFGIDGKFYERTLDQVGLTLNANALPADNVAAFRPSGVRLGTPALTTRGLSSTEMKQIAKWLKTVAVICQKAITEENLTNYAEDLAHVRDEVHALAHAFPVPTDN